MGATDPTSGTASINEVIRGLGVLLKSGWKPLRTIVIASWDAEEVTDYMRLFRKHRSDPPCLQYGLIGSTEWGEDFADFIDKYVVAYLNVGTPFLTFFFAGLCLAHFSHRRSSIWLSLQCACLPIIDPCRARYGREDSAPDRPGAYTLGREK